MTDDPAPDTGATDGRTDSRSSETGLEAENRELRSQVEELSATLADVQEELAELKEASDVDDQGVRAPAAPETADATPELATQGGQPTKVIGRLSDDNGIGVLGEATGSGSTTGVWGTVDSSDGHGIRTPDDARIDGTLEMSNSSSDPNIQFSSQGDAYMYMFESGTGNSDQNIISHSSNYPDWGLRYDDNGDDFVFQQGGTDVVTVDLGFAGLSVNKGDLGVEQGNLAVSNGYVDAGEGFQGNVGASVSLGSDQSVTDSQKDDVEYDTIEKDDRSEFDTTNNKFDCKYAGDYHVNAAVEVYFVPEGGRVQLEIWLAGTRKAVSKQYGGVPSNERMTVAVSKTLKDVSTNDSIKIKFANRSGTDLTLTGLDQFSHLEITQVG